uniref:Uncharacterized protein n=1 Tax=Nelumbo nucifera TaxID=4432 RepID=A0A822Y307_NELNU|nr:TPA_asm: hypothetical protein HUJ06_028110 [Nelumbo nucifera]
MMGVWALLFPNDQNTERKMWIANKNLQLYKWSLDNLRQYLGPLMYEQLLPIGKRKKYKQFRKR